MLPLAIIGHLQRLWPEYDFSEPGIHPGNFVYFTLNLSTAIDGPSAQAVTAENLRSYLLPHLWRTATAPPVGMPLPAGGIGFSAQILTPVTPPPPPSPPAPPPPAPPPPAPRYVLSPIAPADIEFVPFPVPVPAPVPPLDCDRIAELLEYHIDELLADGSTLGPFVWDQASQVGDQGAADGRAFRNLLAYYSTLPPPVGYAVDLAFCFRIRATALAGLAAGGLLVVAPNFDGLTDGSANPLHPDGQPVPVTSPLQSGQPVSWKYVPSAPAAGAPALPASAVGYTLYVNPLTFEVDFTAPSSPADTPGSNSLLDTLSGFVVGNPFPGKLGSDWTSALEDQVAAAFDLAQGLVTAARSASAALLAFGDSSPGFDTLVLKPLRQAVLTAARDVAGAGLFPGPDGDCLADGVLAAIGASEWEQKALRAAFARFDRDVTLDSWRAIARGAIPGISGTRAMTDGTPAAAAPRGRAAFDDELHELEQIASAFAKEENARAAVLAQWDLAAAASVVLPRPADAVPTATDPNRLAHAFYDVYPRPFRQSDPMQLISQIRGAIDFSTKAKWTILVSGISAAPTGQVQPPLTIAIQNTDPSTETGASDDFVRTGQSVSIAVAPAAGTITVTVGPQTIVVLTDFAPGAPATAPPYSISIELDAGSAPADPWTISVTYPGPTAQMAPLTLGPNGSLSGFANAFLQLSIPEPVHPTDPGVSFAPVVVCPMGANDPAVQTVTALWQKYRATSTASALPSLSARRRLTRGNVGRSWSRLLPDHNAGADADDDQVVRNIDSQLATYFTSRVTGNIDSIYDEYRPLFAGLPAPASVPNMPDPPGTALFKAIATQGIGGATVKTTTADDDTPTPRANPLMLPFDRATAGGTSGAGDQSDLQRQLSGICVFLRADRTVEATDAYRSLNFACLQAAVPHRVRPFTSGEASAFFTALAGITPFAGWTNLVGSAPPVDDSAMLAFLNAPPAQNAVLFTNAATMANTPALVLAPDTTHLLKRISVAPADPTDCLHAFWWILQDLLYTAFETDNNPLIAAAAIAFHDATPQTVVPDALVPSRVTYRNGLRQAFVTYDNQPLIAASPIEELTKSAALADMSADASQSSGDHLLSYQLAASSPWAKMPALMDGQNYSYLIAAPTNAGALPAVLAAGHPSQLIAWQAGNLVSTTPVARLTAQKTILDFESKTQYLRRRRVGAPTRCDSQRMPLDNSSAAGSVNSRSAESTLLLPPVPDVAPILLELPTEVVSADSLEVTYHSTDILQPPSLVLKNGPKTYFYDEGLRAGSLDLTAGNWSATLERIRDRQAAAGDSLTLAFQKIPTPTPLADMDQLPAFQVTVTRQTATAASGFEMLIKVSQIPDTDPKTSASYTGAVKWPDEYDLRVAVQPAAHATSSNLTVLFRVAGSDWQLASPTPSEIDASFFNGDLARICVSAAGGATRTPVVYSAPKVQIVGDTATDSKREQTLVVLPHPSLPKPGNSWTFYVAPPTVDLNTWDRWVARDMDIETDPNAKKLIRDRRARAWTAFHEDAGASGAPGTPATGDRGLDDPSVSQMLVELTPLFPATGAPMRQLVTLPPDTIAVNGLGQFQRKPLAVTVTRQAPGAVNPTPSTDGTVQLNVAWTERGQNDAVAGGYLLRVYAAVDVEYFTPGTARFPEAAAEGLPAYTYTEVGKNTASYVLMSPLAILIEVAPAVVNNQWIDSKKLWNSLQPSRVGNEAVVRLARPAGDSLALDQVSQVTLGRQSWRWEGRPVPRFPSALRDDLDRVPVTMTPGTVETPFEWDAYGFGDRPDSDQSAQPVTLKLNDAAPLLYEQDFSGDDRAQYLRFSLTARHRYAGLGSLVFSRSAGDATIAARNDILAANDPFRRLFVPCRWSGKPIPKPRIRFLVPLTQGSGTGSAAGKPGVLVVLYEPWHAVGGVAEFLEAEIVTVLNADMSQRLPEFGPDPILTGAREPIADMPAFTADGAIGYTFDTGSAEPLFVGSSVFVRPSVVKPDPAQPNSAQPDHDWFHARVRFRRRLEIAPTANTALSLSLDPAGGAATTLSLAPDVTLCEIRTSSPFPAAMASASLQFGQGSSRLILPVSAIQNPAHADFDLTIVLDRDDASSANQTIWNITLNCRLVGQSDWNAIGFGALSMNEPIAISVAGAPAGLDAPLPLTLTPLTIAQRSDSTDPYWIQLLPDVSDVRDAGKNTIAPQSLALAFGAANDAAGQPSMSLTNAKTNASVQLFALADPLQGSKNVFQSFLMLTQKITDAFGLGGQEKYVGLFRVNNAGEIYSVGALTVPPSAQYQLRRAVFQRRLETLPRVLDSMTTLLNAQYYEKAQLQANSGAAAWDIQLHHIQAMWPANPAPSASVTLTLSVIASTTGIAVAALSIVFDATGAVTQIRSSTGTAPVQIAPDTRLLDLRLTLAGTPGADSGAMLWTAGFNFCTDGAKWESDAGLPSGALDATFTGKISGIQVKIDGGPASVTYLPPSLTAEPWDHIFPLDPEDGGNVFPITSPAGKTDPQDVLGRLVGISPPLLADAP